MTDTFTPIENQIAAWRAANIVPRNLRLVYDMPTGAEPERKFKPGDLVKVRDDVEDYGGKVGMVIEDDGTNDWPFSVQIHGKPVADQFNAIDLDPWSPSN
jgi:hypothetical protein